MWEPNRKKPNILVSVTIMVGAALAFFGLIFFLIDRQCAADIEAWWTRPYPNAETVSVEHKDWFRPRAIGETKWLMHSDDDVETVKQWYRALTMEVLQSEVKRGLAQTDYSVQPADNGGSNIFLYSSCSI